MSTPRSKFISYLTQSDSRKSSFKSYIEDEEPGASNGNSDYTVSGSSSSDVEDCASQFFDQALQPQLLPGETIAGEAHSVLKFAAYSNGRQGMSGVLYVTNFRLAFVTADRSSYDLPGKRNRSKFLGDDDIPLTNVDAIYQVSTSGKRKKMTVGSHTSSKSEVLEVYCKDMKIHKFGFKFTPKTENKQFVNILVAHAFIKKENLLFAYEYIRKNDLSVRHMLSDTPMFDDNTDWEREIRRCKADKGWRVTDVNSHFDLSQSLPKYFVVPTTLLNTDLQKAAPHFADRRIPVWCYTHINGNNLVRMSTADVNSEQPQQQKKLLDAVKVAGNQRNSPKLVDVAEVCPSCKDIQESFTKLKKLCMSDSEREFVEQDVKWLTNMDNTRWLQLVSQCLTAARTVVDLIITSKRAVVIQEESGCELSCLLSSVAQVLLDPYYRTIQGLQALIQKEWVRMGYPFQEHHSLVTPTDSDCELVPVFLLFLDCVWQLQNQFPSDFEYAETYLTTIWDTALIGIFDTFLFNNDHQRDQFCKASSKNIKKMLLPSAWKWDMQLNNEDLSFFKNPLYFITHDQDVQSSIKDLHDLSISGEVSQNSRRTSNNKSQERNFKAGAKFSTDGIEIRDVLMPQSWAPAMQVWAQCYLRWQTPAQILSGGAPASYLQQCHMVEEIVQLQHKSRMLQLSSSSGVQLRSKSDLIFSHQPDTPNISELLNSTIVTSSFPFSPGPVLRDQQLSFTPISAYLRESSLEWDKFIEQDDE